MKKSIVALGLLLCVVLVLGLAACGGSEETSSTATDESTSTTLGSAAGSVAAEGKWERLDAVGQLPSARAFASLVYDPDGQRFFMFGGGTEGANFGDLWTYNVDSARWTALSPEGDGPSPRQYAPLVYDEVGKKLYLFGGWDDTEQEDLGDTWCYDPATDAWTQIETAGPAPSGRDGHSLVYDPAGKRIVMFGGSDQRGLERDDTWSFDPAEGTWTELEDTGSRPAPRAWHSVAYDSTEERMIIFGGAQGEEDSDVYLNDTWAFDLAENEWVELKPDGDLPGGRFNAAMVYHPETEAVFLYAGGTLAGASRDMWAYNTAEDAWVEVRPKTVPDAGFGHAMVLDPDTGQLLMFGGFDLFAGDVTNEIWAYRPADTAPTGQGTLASAPSPRTGSPVVYDPDGKRMMLFGGTRFSYDDAVPSVDLHDTWAFDPITRQWQNLNPTGDLPGSRSNHALAYDPVGKRMILFGGGTDTNGFGDTWSYDPVANRWTELRPAGTSPSPRVGHRMVYDPASKTMILFGGSDSEIYLDETWAYDPAANRWSELRPQGDAPQGRSYHIMFHDGERTFVLGGSIAATDDEEEEAGLDEVWAYDSKANTWTMLDAFGQAPSSRYIPVGAYDPDAKRLVLFGGADSRSYLDLSDTWRYDPAKGSWSEFVPEDAVPASREDQAMVYDPLNGKVFMFGGMRINNEGEDFEFLNDIWEYDCGSNTWLELTPAGSTVIQALQGVLPRS